MQKKSRTARIILNAKVALLFYFINLILQFFSRKIFIDYLGAELLGLNTTAHNLLQFLNLAESGIGAAIAFSLYKPLSINNHNEINEIVSIQGWFYRKVAIFIIATSIILMSFFPLIFSKANIPLWCPYAVFLSFLVSTLLTYFVNYKIIVLSADQKEYKIIIETQTIKVIKIFIQMFAVWHLSNGYVWWLVLEVMASISTSARLSICVKKEYPWLKTNISQGNYLKTKYSFVLVKTKQMFFHKIGAFVLSQITPLVIYAFTSLTIVAIYGNYLIIMEGCLALVRAFSKGLNAGVGNLVAEGNKERIKSTFWKLTTLRLFLSGMVCSGIFLLSDSFVALWLGDDYIMPLLPMAVLTAIYFIQMNRTSEIFLSAYGLFHDIWAPVVESLLSLSLSIILGYSLGLSGIFLGVLISQIIIVNSWKALFLFKEGFQDPIYEYVFPYTKKLFILSLVFIATCIVLSFFTPLHENNYLDWLIKSFIVVASYSSVGILLFYFFDPDFNSIMRQIFGKYFRATAN